MKIAIFGRSNANYNKREITLLFGKICSRSDVELHIYKPLWELLETMLPEGYVSCPISFFTCGADLDRACTLFLSLGGDGTFLDSIPIVGDSTIPVAGINFGRLGFLTTAKVGDSSGSIESLLCGRFSVEERSLLELNCKNDVLSVPDSLPSDERGALYKYALNEIALQRRDQSILEIQVNINGTVIPTYYSDGLLIATPTGSTAYSLSIGGPIVTPESKVMIIAPIAPHNLNVRPIVVPEDSVVTLEYDCRGNGALLTLDNRSRILPKRTPVTISKGSFPIRRVAVDNSFIEALSQKLMWGQDRRNNK